MADHQGLPLPVSWRNPGNRSLANDQGPEHFEAEEDDSSLQGFQQLNSMHGMDAESHRHPDKTRPHHIGGPPNRHIPAASESLTSSVMFGLNSGTVPDIPAQTRQHHRNARLLYNLAQFGASPEREGDDMYKDLLKRLNNMGIEIPGHTDKARNKAPGADSFATSNGTIGEGLGINHGLFPAPSADQARLVQPARFPYFAAPDIMDNQLAALLNDQPGNDTPYLASHDEMSNHLLAGYTQQALAQNQTFQSHYPSAGYPPASTQQHHCRVQSLAGRSSALPPNCATAATFSPSATYGHPASPAMEVPSLTTTTIPFKPMLMVQELQNRHYDTHHPGGANMIHANDPTILNFPSPTAAALLSTGCSDNYKGNHFLSSNRSANIADKDNCSFFITGLPPGIDTRILLAHIRDVGRIFASYINPINPVLGHLTSAAKLVFFEKTAAQHFWERHRDLPLMVCKKAAKVVRNRIRVAEPDWPRSYTRVVVISGPAEIVERGVLLKIFEAHFVFHVDTIIEDPLELPDVDVEQGWRLPEGWRTIEIRFGSWRSQAQTSFQVLGNHPDYRGVRIRYGRDPCDRVRESERHLYHQVLGSVGGFGGEVDLGPVGFDAAGVDKLCGSDEQDNEEEEVWEEAEQEVEMYSPLLSPPPIFGAFGGGVAGIVKLGSSVGSLAATPLLSQSNSQRSCSNNSSASSGGFSEIASSLRSWRRTPGPPSSSRRHNAQNRNDDEEESELSSLLSEENVFNKSTV